MYVKLFASIYQGTLRGNSHGLLVFTNLLAHADKEGVVDVHPRAISEEVGLPIDVVRATLEMLESPDDESRSPEEQGRRIIRTDEHRAWGWKVVNYAKYRAIRSEEDRREQNRIAQEKWRKKNKPASADSKPDKPPSAQAEADVEVKKTLAPQEGRFPEFWASWPATDRKADRKKCSAKWLRCGFDSEADAIISHVLASKNTKKWQDGFEPAPLTYLNGERWKDGAAVVQGDRFAGAI